MKHIFFLTSLSLAASILLAPACKSGLTVFNVSPDVGNDIFIDWIALSPVPPLPTEAFSKATSEDTSEIFDDWTAFNIGPDVGNDIFIDWIA